MGLFKSTTVSTTSQRVSSFMVTSSSYGSPLKLIFGTTMIAPVLIDYDDFKAIAHTETTSSGGKGGSVKSSNTTYTYTVMALMALGEGVLTGTGNIWEGSKVTNASALGLTFFSGLQGGNYSYNYYNETATVTTDVISDVISITLNSYVDNIYYVNVNYGNITETVSPSNYSLSGSVLTIIFPYREHITYIVGYRYHTIYGGGQLPWGYLITNHPNKALTYSGTSYLAGVLDLGDSSSLPNFNIEVFGLCQSQSPSPSTVKCIQTAYIKTVEAANYASNINVQEYVYGGTNGNYWTTIDSRYYTIEVKKDAYGNNTSTYTYTFNFDDRTDGYDRDDPMYIRINYNATTASISYTPTDANPRDIIYTILTNTVYGANFPSVLVNNMDNYSSYCKTNSLLLSPSYDSQQQTSDIITNLAEATNSEYVFSQGKANMVPYYDNLTPVYDITDDNIIDQGENTLSIQRTSQSDTYNVVPLEYLDRNNQYNTDIVYASDEGNIDVHGLRQSSTKSHHEIMNASLAQTVAQMILQKQINRRNTFTLKLGQEFILLEPMDPNTLTFELANLDITAVRVVSIKESKDDYTLEITFENNPSGMTTAPKYETQDTTRASLNLDVNPGNVNYPIIFEAPDTLVESGLGFEVWMYASGGEYWGGANVWISQSQDGDFKKIGSIQGKARQGILSTALLAGNDPDTINTPIIDLTMSSGTLKSGTQQDANNYNTLCYINGEFISYETATLTALNKYQLSYLRRGIYNSTIANHAVNSQFVRMDDAVFKYPFTKDDIGKTVYIKFTSLNIYGAGEQNLSDVSAYQYTIKGTSLTTPLPNVTNLTNYYENGNMYLTWAAVSDFRSPIEYEIRKGNAWSSAEILGRTFNTKYQVQGNGNYFISAAYQNVYSTIPTEIEITGARYTANVIATVDERDTGWTGTKTIGLNIRDSDNVLWLTGAGNFDDIPDIDSVSNIDFYGGVTSTGTYTIPESHRVDIGKSSLCNVSVNYTAFGDTINNTFDLIDNVDSITNWDGDYSANVSFKVQIRIAMDDGVFGNWQDFYVGQYNGRIFDFRIILNSTDANTTAIVSDFSFSVDVPDLSESKNISIPAGGITINYENNYHTIPYPQITITDGISGDTVIFPTVNMTKTGFFVKIVDGNGNDVNRRGSYLVQSY